MGFGKGRGFSMYVDKWRKKIFKVLVLTAPTVSEAAEANLATATTATEALTVAVPTVSATAAVV